MSEKPEYKKFAIGALIVASFCLPIFRSGGKTGLSFWGWVRNHTIFSPAGPEYVPEEDYMAEMEGVKCVTEVKQIPRSTIESAMSFYQISQVSAQKLLSH